jgi:hypothetical protein
MGNTREHWTIWVCTNCIMHAANGECGDCHREEGHEGGEPLSLLSPQACPGMGYEDHSEDCEVHIRGEWPDNYECDCETNTYSTSSCDGCGSSYHGERHAMTEWSE